MKGQPTAVLLVNSHASLGGADLDPAAGARAVHHVRTPRALLPSASGRCILDEWWLAMCEGATPQAKPMMRTFLVTNAAYFKHFERWATANHFPTDHIINDGTTSGTDALGVAASLALLKRRTSSAESMVVLAAEQCMNAAATVELTTWLRHQSTADTSCDAALRTSDAPDFEVVALRLRARMVATLVEHEAELTTRTSLRTVYGALGNYAPSAPADGLAIDYTTLATVGSVWMLGDGAWQFDGWGVPAAEQLLAG